MCGKSRLRSQVPAGGFQLRAEEEKQTVARGEHGGLPLSTLNLGIFIWKLSPGSLSILMERAGDDFLGEDGR